MLAALPRRVSSPRVNRTSMPIRRIRRALAAIVVTAVSTGCFEYIPIDVSALPEGRQVRVYLTVQESRRLEDEGMLAGIELGSPPALVGRLARRAQEMLYLRVPVRGPQVGFQAEPLEQEIPLRAEGVATLEWRELNLLGTAAVAVASARWPMRGGQPTLSTVWTARAAAITTRAAATMRSAQR